MTHTVGVILSGCGYLDGAEIHESVCTLLALDRAGVTIRCFAPNIDFDVVDHRTGKLTGEQRNALVEAARIARGDIDDVANADASKLDALILPGRWRRLKGAFDIRERGRGLLSQRARGRVAARGARGR